MSSSADDSIHGAYHHHHQQSSAANHHPGSSNHHPKQTAAQSLHHSSRPSNNTGNPANAAPSAVAGAVSSSSSASNAAKSAHQLSAQQLQHHHHLTASSVAALPSEYASSSSAASSVSSVSLNHSGHHHHNNMSSHLGGSSSMMAAIGTQTMHSDTLNARNNPRKSSLTSYAHLLHHSNSSASVATDCSSHSASATGAASAASAKLAAYEAPAAPLGHHQSPSRFQVSDSLGLHLGGGRLSIHSVASADRFGTIDDDRMAGGCCLPPPSPAPNSDRYIIGMPAPSSGSGVSSSAQQDLKFSVMHHRSMSPSSRYRSSMPDRYVTHHRDISPKCDRFGPSSLPPVATNNMSVSSSSSSSSQSNYNLNAGGGGGSGGGGSNNSGGHSDSYAYLSAVAAASTTVHTPVKRYVPTPPPLSSIEYQPPSSDAQQQQQRSAIHSGHSSTLPYRYRIKCCPADTNAAITTSNHNNNHSNTQQAGASDHYATPPRVRPVKCSALSSSGPGSSSTLPTSSITASSTSNNGVVRTSIACEYASNAASSVSATNEQRAATPLSSAATATSDAASAKTCLHCSTMRRTTGVHQTTQTNGPISPIPGATNAATPTMMLPSAATSSLGSASQSSSTSSMANCASANGSSTSGIAADVGSGSLSSSSMAGSSSSSPGPGPPLSATSSNASCSSNTSGILSGHQQQQSGSMSPITGDHHQQKHNSIKSGQHHKMTGTTNAAHTTTSTRQQLQLQQQLSQHQMQQQQRSSSGSRQLSIQQQVQSQSQYLRPASPQPQSAPSSSASSATGLSVLQQQQQQHQQHHHQQQQHNQQQQQLQQLQQQQHQLQMHHQLQSQQQHQQQQQQQNSPTLPPQAPSLVVPPLLHAPLNPSNTIHMSRKQRVKDYVRRGTAKFFGVDCCSETMQRHKWAERQRRLAARRFGALRPDADLNGHMGGELSGVAQRRQRQREQHGDRPDILPPAQTMMMAGGGAGGIGGGLLHQDDQGFVHGLELVERKASVATMLWQGVASMVQLLGGNRPRVQRQWSRSFAPGHLSVHHSGDATMLGVGDHMYDAMPLHDDEVFFDSPGLSQQVAPQQQQQSSHQAHNHNHGGGVNGRPMYMGERVHGWRTRTADQPPSTVGHSSYNSDGGGSNHNNHRLSYRGTRISAQILDGVLDNSRRPLSASAATVKLLRPGELDDRHDHRPFFTYWISTVQILVLCVALVCYGLGPIGYGTELKTGQVLVTTLSLQQVQHHEPRNVWIGPRGDDLVHLGAKFAACMRRDTAVWEAIGKTRRQERETACCIRNDDSGCVQSSQAECSVRGLWPTKSISTWKKWSPGESGPGGRISGSVCGLDPKFCDAPASVAPYEWPDDITKWPICRKTNSFSQRFRFKDHTAEHMVCEVIGHPCCTGVYGECRITTREFCDFVNGYFHEEASLCSQVSCLNDVCGMFPFLAFEQPDQFYRLFTSLCLHAGILHLALTVAFQHIFLADLERLIGPIRTAILYIGSGVAGNLTSAIFEPYKPEVGPLASLAGVTGSLVSLLGLIHWRHLRKPHVTLAKLTVLLAALFGMGNLPWQQNVMGLLAGSVFGMALTVALVPFVSFTKYGRQSKINFIWTCLLSHAIIYVGLFVIFYIFPATFAAMGWTSGSDSLATHVYSNGGYSIGGNVVSCDKGMCPGIGGGTTTTSGGSVLHQSSGGGGGANRMHA